MMVNAILQINPETRSKFCFQRTFAEKVWTIGETDGNPKIIESWRVDIR